MAYAKKDLGLLILGVGPEHVVPFLIGDHRERQFIMIAEKQAPLGCLGNGGSLLKNILQRKAIFPV